jgi:hypothetical protein
VRKGNAKGRREKHCLAMGHDVAHAKTAFALRPSRNLRVPLRQSFHHLLSSFAFVLVPAFVCGV